MAREVRLPQLGQTMEEGTIVNITIKPGDTIDKGDVIFEVETDKATLEVESPAAGTVKNILVNNGDTIPVNDPLLVLGEKDEEVDQTFLDSLKSDTSAPPQTPSNDSPSSNAKTASDDTDLPDDAKLIRLPQLGQTMEEGTIVNILPSKGDKIEKGDVLLEVETDKATLEMESPQQGTLKALLVNTGDTIPVNDPVAILADENTEISQETVDALKSADSPQPAPAQKTAEPAAQPQTETAPAPAQTTTPTESAPQTPDGAKVIRLPQLGQTMEEGTILNIVVKPGDKINKGDVLCEVETDKATLEMESPEQGTLKAFIANEGDTIPVNEPLAVLAQPDTDIPDSFIQALKAAPAQTAQPAQTSTESAPKVEPERPAAPVKTTQTTAAPPTGQKVFASPRAKLVAKQLGIDINSVPKPASKPRITEADVRKAAASPSPTATAAANIPQMPPPQYKLGQKVPITRMQKIVGQRMLQSKQQIPCFYLNTVVDMTETVKTRTKLNKTGSVKIAFNDFIIKAVAVALKQFPIMTGQLKEDHIQLAPEINIGLAIAVEDGLVAPLSKNADQKSLPQIAEYNKALIKRAKSNALAPDDLAGGCITVSNLGGFGIDSFIPIVVPGQCSILGVGKISDTCVPSDGNIMVRKMMNLNLSVDHKVANGADAAQFLDYIRKLLENPDAIA